MKIGKLILFIFFFLISCDDDTSNEGSFVGRMTADVSGDHNFKFESDDVLVTYQPSDGGLGFIYVSSNIQRGDTVFSLTASRNNDTLLVGDTFQRSLPNNGVKVYESFTYGIDEEDLIVTRDSIIGEFEFTALYTVVNSGAINFDTVYIKNGYFSYIRKN